MRNLNPHHTRTPGTNPLPAWSGRVSGESSNSEAGVALAMVIIALLLVTAIGAAMIVLSNSEINVDANYRDEQVALYAAKAGLQEARDRMLAKNANPITLPCVLPGATVLGGCATTQYATYIIASGVSPSTGSLSTNPEYDTEFANELNGTMILPTSSTWLTTTATNSNYSGSATNPLPYQWVRINLKVDGSGYNSNRSPYYVDGTSSNAGKQVLYDWTNLHQCVAGTGTCATSSNLQPVYEITSFAITNSGTHRMLQDDVAAQTFNLSFPSALTMPGPVGSFNPANSSGYCMDGHDDGSDLTKSSKCSFDTPPAVPGCSAGTGAGAAIGLSAGNDAAGTATNVNYVTNQIPCSKGNCLQNNYTGSGSTTPSVSTVTLPTDMSSPAQLDQTLQLIAQNSGVCLAATASAASAASCTSPTIEAPGGPSGYTWSQMTSALPGGTWPNSSTNPQIIYVDGNMDISGNTSGSGILVVTGNFTYDGNSSWNGIILVVGDGTTTYNQNGGGNGQFNGALFVATTRDSSGNQLSNFGPVDFNINGGGGNGLYYNSCWINYVQQPVTYKLLSSKEISH